MPYCSQCGVEYIKSADICADCQYPLISRDSDTDSGLFCIYCNAPNNTKDLFCWKCGKNLREIDFDGSPPIYSDDVQQCENCGGYTAAGSDFCVECGYLHTGPRSCVNHPDTMTGFVCLVCQKPLCKKCGGSKDGKFLCSDDKYYNFVGNWVIIASDSHLEGLEPAQLALDEQNIFAVIKDQRDRVQPYLVGNYALFVPIIQLKISEKILVEEKFLYENVCTNCRHEFNGNPNRCPRCGEEFAF